MTPLFLRACRGEAVERTPVWLMRQAGRYLEEYRRLRAAHDFLTLCRTPELATRVTLQPVERLGVDAAILFSDIMIPLPAMGVDVAFDPGPLVAEPVRDRAGIAALRIPDPAADLGFVLEAIAELVRALPKHVPLIGFCGAPFTLLAYLVEGRGSKTWPAPRAMLHADPAAAELLLDRLVETQAAFLSAQIDAGARAIQIFDSWGGILPRDQFERFSAKPLTRLVERIRRPGVPIILYVRDAAHVLDLLAATGADVLSVDEKLPLDRAAALIGPGPALQGNLDPALLLAAPDRIREGVAAVLDAAPRGRGHVFNLGHGVLPQTPVEHVELLVREVRRLSSASGDVR
ncbi:MAG TPA: uroporphyrinogen decarboxylase [Polyangia bacterium]|nr:uroporphyrinogen decarboxylase [Polyangia bacterium]